MPVQPSCAELLAGGYQCARPMTDSNAALDGKTLADVCPACLRTGRVGIPPRPALFYMKHLVK
jgi:hypothetical protein